MRRIFLIALAAVSLIAPTIAQDQEQIDDLHGKAARISRAQNGDRLTSPSRLGRSDVISAFLLERHGHDRATVDSLILESEDAERGHLRLRQQIAGFDVYGTYVRATFTPAGELVSVVENLAAVSRLLPAVVDYADALATTLERRYPGQPTDLQEVGSSQNKVTYARGTRFYQDPTVTRVAVPLKGKRLRVGYLVETWDHENQLWHTVVSGTGAVLFEELRTAGDRYNVFANAPDKTPQAVVDGPGLGNAESPEGWLVSNTATTTTGNNVDAYLDRVNDNVADPNGRPVSTTREFLTAADLAQSPTLTSNQMAAVTNLFYLNNVLHDKLYKHGFNEAAGNFQANNFGKGGAGNDPVNAEAQDGGGSNNANFATPADGSRPRMQMYLWTSATPSRDGDLDSDIVYHEYGHGLTWRMIGSMSGPFAGAIGEGMSDTLAIYINRDDRVAEYSKNNSVGIRRFPYTNYPNTYSDVTGSSVHADGEIYAAAMWKLLELWEASGRSQDLLFDRVINGMNFTPSRPAYENMRDGILAAAPTLAEDCVIWKAFAQFGIGEGADGVESCNFLGRCSISVKESFAVPSSCSSPAPNAEPAVTITAPENNSSFTQGAPVTFTGTANDTEDGNLTAALTWTSSLQGPLGTGGSFTRNDLALGTHVVTASVTDKGGLTGSATRTVTITAAPAPTGITLSTRGYKLKGVRHADLEWTGAAASVDIFRNNEKLVTSGGTSYTDTIVGKGGGTFDYQVCNAGTTTCSNVSRVIF